MKIINLKVGDLETNCYILKTDKEAFIIDPGGDPEKILEHVEKQEVKIINTHHHFDHTLANDELKEKLNAEVFIHEDEKDFVDFKVDRFLKEGDVLKIGDTELKVLHTPGHTQGGICLFTDDFVFSGDTLFENGYGRVDLPGGDFEKMSASLKRIQGMLKNNTTIYPGHGEPFKWEN